MTEIIFSKIFFLVKIFFTQIIFIEIFSRQYEECCSLLWKLSLNSADVLLEDLSVSDLLLHLPSLPRIATKHQETRCESVKTVDGSQVLEIIFLGQDEDHSVVTVSATRMDLQEKDVVSSSQNEKFLLKQRVKLLSNRLFQFSVTVERIGDDVVNQHHF